jgi:8-oxo-dGTP diphosphatase
MPQGGGVVPRSAEFYYTGNVVVAVSAATALALDTQILVVTRSREPFIGRYSLPGGHVEPGETAQAGAVRELAEETGLNLIGQLLEDVGTFDTPGRDPRGNYVTRAFAAVLGDVPVVRGDDDAATAEFVPAGELLQARMAFDHAEIVVQALGLLLARHILVTVRPAG